MRDRKTSAVVCIEGQSGLEKQWGASSDPVAILGMMNSCVGQLYVELNRAIAERQYKNERLKIEITNSRDMTYQMRELVENISAIDILATMSKISQSTRYFIDYLTKFVEDAFASENKGRIELAMVKVENQINRFVDYSKTIMKLQEGGVIRGHQSGQIINVVGSPGAGNPYVGLPDALRNLGAFGEVHDPGQKDEDDQAIDVQPVPEQGS